jgi:hypothetical protein
MFEYILYIVRRYPFIKTDFVRALRSSNIQRYYTAKRN